MLTVKKTSLIASSKRVNGLTLMGVVPDDFGRTWDRSTELVVYASSDPGYASVNVRSGPCAPAFSRFDSDLTAVSEIDRIVADVTSGGRSNDA